MNYTLFICLLICVYCHTAQAQTDTSKPKAAFQFPSAIVLDFSFGVQTPMANMRDNFKTNLNIAGKINFFTPKHYIFALQGEYIYSDNICTDVVSNLRNPDGLIVDKMGTPSNIALGQRGFFIGASIAKLFIFNPNKRRRAGLETRLTFGYLQHKIRLKVPGTDMVQIQGDYRHGYDRLTAGFAMQQYVGYRYMSPNRLINYFIGVDFLQGFTHNLRGYNFNERKVDTGLKIDMLLGIRAGLAIPFPIYTQKNTQNGDLYFY
jgi:hypothetical protein